MAETPMKFYRYYTYSNRSYYSSTTEKAFCEILVRVSDIPEYETIHITHDIQTYLKNKELKVKIGTPTKYLK